MYLTVHASAGILIGSQVGNPWLAFILGVLSHFVLDAIPHDSIELHNWREKGNGIKKFLLEGVVDLLLLTLIILWLQSYNLIDFEPSILFGVAGALVPDFIWVFAEFFNIKNLVFDKYKQFHDSMHKTFLKDYYIPLKYSIPIQVINLVIFLGLYLFFKP
ncbi:MAG: hypothetical protein ABIJ91_00145 [Candidatus Kuenenbacteria bacterium]